MMNLKNAGKYILSAVAILCAMSFAAMTAVAQEVARRTGYRIDTHRLELFGLCPACAAADGALIV